MKEHYELLNLREGADLSEIKTASRKLLLKYHPDLNPSQKDWALEKTKRVLHAYEVLTKKNVRQDVVFRTSEELRKKQSQPSTPVTSAFMVFQAGTIQFAVPVEQVCNVTALSQLSVTRITPQKGLYPYIIGVVNSRGSIIPLLDLRTKFQLTGQPNSDNHVVICSIENQQLGLVIDKGMGVSYIKNSELITGAPEMQNAIAKHHVTATFSKQGQIVHVLDLTSIIRHE